MLGDILKELVVGLWRFLRYHLARLAGFDRMPMSQQETDSPKPGSSGADAGAIVLPDQARLSETYMRPVRLSTSRRDIDNEEFGRNPVFQIWKQQQKPRAHKWVHYFEAYHSIFGPSRHQALRILEIGVYEGASLRLWRRYFDDPKTVIVGIDIDATCARFDSPRESVHVRIGSQDDASFLGNVTREFGPFDIIIDDGSHRSSHMIASFNHLFADALKDDGIYLAEDLHANYWTPWRDTQRSFLDLCKELMEVMHAHYTCVTIAPWLRESDSVAGSENFSLDLPFIATMIKEIRVLDSIVAIYKTRRDYLPRVLNPLADLDTSGSVLSSQRVG